MQHVFSVKAEFRKPWLVCGSCWAHCLFVFFLSVSRQHQGAAVYFLSVPFFSSEFITPTLPLSDCLHAAAFRL